MAESLKTERSRAMSCEICGKGSCKISFHSIAAQEEFDRGETEETPVADTQSDTPDKSRAEWIAEQMREYGMYTQGDEVIDLERRLRSAEARAEVAENDAEHKDDALQKLSQWARAYPLSVFPEPDWTKAAKVLRDAGMTLDAISAANMRHVITQAQKIIDSALDAQEEKA